MSNLSIFCKNKIKNHLPLMLLWLYLVLATPLQNSSGVLEGRSYSSQGLADARRGENKAVSIDVT